ncbi:MAG: zinc-binding dehydrogenase, partial [Acidimicrobiia bacterium]|nr:zinc-binding dehydrogenase [Acidimicrobiia bacterium]
AGLSPQVGVVGVGGLGHLAIQFGRALGWEVTAISSSPGKEKEALAFGARHFVVATDREAMKQVEYRFDLLLCTAHGGIDWETLLMALKKNGRLVLVSFPRLVLDSIDLVAHQLSVTGSFMANRATMREMLAFANEHRITPQIELMPMSQVNAAIGRLRENRARYRIVVFKEPEVTGEA